MALLVVEHFGDAVPHGGDQRIGRAEVNAYRQTMLVRGGRHAGFGDLQQGHNVFLCLCFQRFEGAPYFVGKLLDEHQLPHALAGLFIVPAIEQRGDV